MNFAVNEVLDEGKSVKLSPKQEVYEGTPCNDPNVKNALEAEAAKRQANVKRTVRWRERSFRGKKLKLLNDKNTQKKTHVSA